MFQVTRSLRYQDFISGVLATLNSTKAGADVVAKAIGELSDHGDSIDGSMVSHLGPDGNPDQLERQINEYINYVWKGGPRPEWLDY